MSKKFKSQASSARAASALTGGFGSGSLFQTTSSPLSYVTEAQDLSQISEPSIVVAFKNLGKRDSITKAKALEELHDSCGTEVESSVLQAWADTYPRTSIDNSRRVRQLAHALQGNLTVSAGKRIAPLIPKLIGPWLSGTFDSDKSVARSAQYAIERSFTTPEKRKALWSLYKSALFEYIQDAILVQTVATLSDERTTSADDALAKYVRVVGTAMNVLGQLLRDGANDDSISVLLNDKKLWEFAHHNDSYLRRSLDELAIVASERFADQLDWATVSTSLISKGLHTSQMGSSRQFTTALLVLTKRRPEIWTSDYTAKTAVSRRLIQFLRQGSQNGPEEVWSNIASLVRLIPQEVWLGDGQLEGATKLAEALRSGVTQPTERVNAASAWAAYVQTCLWLAERITTAQDQFVSEELAPIVKQFVTKKEDSQWNPPVRAVQICKGVLVGIARLHQMSVFEKLWEEVVSSTVDEMKLSQPETSKDFTTSQDAVIEQAKRLYSVKWMVSNTAEASSEEDLFRKYDDIMLNSAIQLLRTRNGKPYSAAAIIEMIVTQKSFDKNNKEVQKLTDEDAPSLMTSPSAEKLASICLSLNRTSIINVLLATRSKNSDRALIRILPEIKAEHLDESSQQQMLNGDIQNESDRHTMVALMQNRNLTPLHSVVCERIEQALSPVGSLDSQEAALAFLEESLARPNSADAIATSDVRQKLMSNLLILMDAGDVLSERAGTIVTVLNSKSNTGSSSISIVQQQLNGEGTPLSVFTLLDLANGALQTDGVELDALIPTSDAWTKAISPHASSPLPYSLSITSPLQGLIYVIQPGVSRTNGNDYRDHDGFSLLFRLVLYTTRLLASDLASKINSRDCKPLWMSYPVALQLVNAKLTIDQANQIWTDSTAEVLQEAADVLGQGQRLISSWLVVEDFTSYWMKIPHQLHETDLATYNTSLAWFDIATQWCDRYGSSQLLNDFEDELKVSYKSDFVVRSAALLAVLRDYLMSTPYGKRVLNELVASVTELEAGSVKQLVLLNIFLHGESDNLETVPTQRVVFLLKNLVRLLVDRNTTGMQPEVMKILTVILTQVSDIYGEHWEQILNNLVKVWSTEIGIPVINASVRLYARIKSLLSSEEVNEDLQEAWKLTKADLHAGLLTCLQHLGNEPHGIDQPQTITAELIRRQLHDVEIQSDDNMFVLLSSPVQAVQTAAFELLHNAIPKRQAQLSIEMILEKQTIRLPVDLTAILENEQSDSRRYMLAWKLVFDHFSDASYKLQESYTTDIKQSGHIEKLLDYICEVLRIVSGRPLDASKFDVVDFRIDDGETPEQEMRWLAIHNYYKALLCVPSLAKDWFLVQKNRVKIPLDTWTQKHISPLIVSASVSIVTDWAGTQSQEEDDRPLTIKTSPHGSELTASIAIDPESPPISLAISLPGNYPLEAPDVVSRKRVGVSEKNWNSWLRTIRIIIFITGSIIEGLIAFRRNVQGALKGQSECAICYSIIGTDMQTPNKKCGTCRNMFHGACLFRWFKSSNSSSCPLCRNNFNYA